MTKVDIKSLLSIQKTAYPPEINEPENILQERFAAAPETAWVAAIKEQVVGYLVGYPSTLGKITELNQTFVPALKPDCLYLHDLAISSTAKGQGIAKRLLEKAYQMAHSLRVTHLALVSVQNSADFWQQQGFEHATRLTKHQQICLESYDMDAFYMVKSLINKR